MNLRSSDKVFGWTGKILDVNLTTGSMRTRDTLAYVPDYIGGRAMASRIAWDEIPPGTRAYAPENRVIVTTGPLTGTLAPTSGRTVMTGVSPRTYPKPWYTHSTLGGWFGAELKYAGYDAIVLHGQAAAPVVLEVQDGAAQLVDARSLWGRDTRETQLQLKERLGQGVHTLAIGPAGENLVRYATVQHAEENAAGSSGFGAVWGSKNLKAIVVRGTGAVPVANPTALLGEVIRGGTFKPTPVSAVLHKGRRAERMSRLKPICSQACTFDCYNIATFGHAPDDRRVPGICMGGVFLAFGYKTVQYSGGGVHVPPGTDFGAEREQSLHDAYNRLGLDLCLRAVLQPWLIRCRQLGVNEIRGYAIDPEDATWFQRFTEQLASRKGLGDLFAEGLRRAVDELEQELPPELIRLGQELEFDFGFIAHREGRFRDREPLPFWVISAMMHISESRDPTIGTHQSSLLLGDFLWRDQDLARRHFRTLSEAVWGIPDALEPTFNHKAPVAIWSQNQHMLIDSLTLCDFGFPQLVRPMDSYDEWETTTDIVGDLDLDRRLFTAVTGVEMSREELDRAAERGFTLERLMLARAGRGRRMEETLAPHFELPCQSDGTYVDKAGFSRLLDEYYAARGWDLEFGWPTADRLRQLGLEDAIPELVEYHRRFADAGVQV